MPTKEFPKVKVDIQRNASENPFYIGALGIPDGPAVPIVYALVGSIQNTGRFVGGSFDMFWHGVRDYKSYINSMIQVPDALVHDIGRQGLVYGIVLDNKNFDKGVEILKTEEEMEESLLHKGRWDSKKLPRTIFVPSPQFTDITWEFSYEDGQLDEMKDYNGMDVVRERLKTHS